MRTGTVGAMDLPGPVRVEAEAGVQYLVVRCACCSAVRRNRIISGRALSPDLFLASVRRAGWEADDKSDKAYCTEHTASKRRKAQRAALLSTVVAEPEQEKAPMNAVTQIAASTAPKPLTTDQRVMVRGLLDKHFDDKVGRYLDGMSDQAIAEAVSVPRIHVTTVREAAYGPLRVTAEMEDMVKANEATARSLAALQRQLDQVQSTLTELAAKIASAAEVVAGQKSRMDTMLAGK